MKDNHVEGKKINKLKLTNHMLTTPFQTMKPAIHVTKMQHIMFFAHQLMMNVNFPILDVYCGSVLTVLLLISQEVKDIHQTEHQ